MFPKWHYLGAFGFINSSVINLLSSKNDFKDEPFLHIHDIRASIMFFKANTNDKYHLLH